MTLPISADDLLAGMPLGPALRPLRRCLRCGREGRNAFRPMSGDARPEAWLCTHREPCQERSRLQQRAAAKRAQGRPSQSPISGWLLDEGQVLVLSAEERARMELLQLLRDVTSADVECLALDRRSLDLLGRRDFGMVVIDLRRSDPVAILNDLARRLSRHVRRGVPVVLIHEPEDDGPAIEALVRGVATHTLTRPIDPSAMVSIVSRLAADTPSAQVG